MTTVPLPTDRRALLQNALHVIDDLQAKLDAAQRARTEPLAIIGMSCRFPGGAIDPEAYWQLLHEGRDAIREAPADRWNKDEFAAENVAWYGGFLDDLDQFDPKFFGITPREATTLDPQQRLVLEVSWEALERAGLAPDRLSGSPTGVFIGITTNDYAQLSRAGGAAQLDVYSATGSALNAAAGRVAYTFGLQGPCMAIDTACSSSLVAVHLACQSLRNGESDLAIAGGVNVILTPDGFVCFSRWGMMAPDGRCKTFDAHADGFVRGEGCGIVVLKRLSDALANGDHVLAVIRGSAVNQDGRSSGLTVPNGLAQQAVVRRALANAGLDPIDVGYIETHGTGTALGDPIEVEALGAVLGQGRDAEHPLTIGSVKTNLGHLESASGMAGLIKVVLSLQHEELPPHLHLHERSPRIPWPDFPIVIPQALTPWPRSERRRIAGVSGFGFSGTNAHVILEEAPLPSSAASEIDRPWHLLTVSAKNEQSLSDLTARYDRYLADSPSDFADICFSANTGHAQFQHRLAVVTSSVVQAREMLRVKQAQVTGHPKIAFLFTGQGAQYVGMGQQLYETQPAFRATIDRCDEVLRPYLGRALIDVLYQSSIADHQSLIDQTAFTQPALFALEYALVELWKSWGIAPMAVLGHSVGEYVAACVAGVFSLEDGLKLIAERGRLMQALPQNGDMVAVFADEATVSAAVEPFKATVSIAAINGPENIVISGARADVQAVIDQLTARGIQSKSLTVSHAFHSPLMQPILDVFEQTAAKIRYADPQTMLISNVTGQRASAEITSSQYWRQHILATVQFAASMSTLQQQGYNTFVEIGPQPTLLSMARRCLPEIDAHWLPSLRSGREDWPQLLESLGTLWMNGAEVDWAGFDHNYRRQRVVLPTYPFQRQRYWLEASARRVPDALSGVLPVSHPLAHPLLGSRSWSPLIAEILFESSFSPTCPAYLDHHRIYGSAIFPATAYIEMALAAAATMGSAPFLLTDLNLHEALILPEEESRTVQLLLVADDESVTFRVLSLKGDPALPPGGQTSAAEWTLHAVGEVRPQHMAVSAVAEPLTAIRARCTTIRAVPDYYQQLTNVGLDYGASFQSITQMWCGVDEVVGEVRLPEPYAAEADRYWLHPALFDSCFHLLGAALEKEEASVERSIYLPIGADRVEVFERAGHQVWCHARLKRDGEGLLSGDLQLFDQTGRLIAHLTGLHLRRASRETLRRAVQAASVDRSHEWLYEIDWRPSELAAQLPDRSTADSYLICADDQGLGAALVARWQAEGQSCHVVTSPEELQAEVGRQAWRSVICLWPLDAVNADPVAASVACVQLVQAMARSRQTAPRLWLITRGAQAIDAGPIAMEQAPVWGLGRVIAVEHPDLRCTCLDLDPAATNTRNVDLLLAEVRAADAENQIAYRNETRLVARLNDRATVAAHHAAPRQLTIAARGMFDHLAVKSMTRRAPGPGEVEIEVQASGLNFRDVLNVLGMYPGEAGAPGNECAGKIVTVGEGVSHLQVGDSVVAIADACFSSYVIARADLVARKPERLTFVEAAAIPIAYLTAYYALDQLGHLQPGERVLIHAASGGVGLAAVQLALHTGAEIFATASSEEKRAYLRSLGVQHVMDSRTLGFAAEITQLTNGAGVDVVLNSLTDDLIVDSLAVLKNGGRFLEIGMRGIWTHEQIESLGRSIQYHVIFLGEVCQTEPALVQSMLQTVLADLDRGVLQLLPVRVFSIEQAAEAFRYMARAKHIGKIVISLPASGREVNDFATKPLIQSNATYLITGGLGGLGLLTAQWLVEQGARYLVLLGRRVPSGEAQVALQALQQQGVEVRVWQSDVADGDQLARVLESITTSLPPLRGIIHAAGILDDGVIVQQDRARFEKVFAPKVQGAWNLHRLTRSLPLDFFVLFSSASAVLGSAGQSNYAAANAFMDALAHQRRAWGLPALSINWGAWSGVGMAAHLEQRLRDNGQGVIPPEQGLRTLKDLVHQPVTQIAVLPIDWQMLARQFAMSGIPPLLSELIRTTSSSSKSVTTTSARRELAQRLKSAPADERRDLVADYLRTQISQVIGWATPASLDLNQPLTSLGLDSLMAVELRNRFQSDLGVVVPVAELLRGPSVNQLARLVLDQTTDAISAQPIESARPDQLLARLDQFSDEEVDSLLSEFLAAEPPAE
jgi:acyl transferase domain-containing protein/acyl carrier protein